MLLIYATDNGDKRLAFAHYGSNVWLNIYGNKMTYDSDFTVKTLNGITPSTISLNTHNHDTLYSKLGHIHSYNDLTDVPETFPPAEHNHDTLYSKLGHVHSYNDLTDVPETFPPT